jgi:hypothetical protein
VELETFLRRRATSPQADYARARLEELKRQQVTTIAPPAKPEKENKPGSEQSECISAGGAGCGVKKDYAQLMAQTAAVKAAQSCHYVVQMDTLTSSCEPTNNGGWSFECHVRVRACKSRLTNAVRYKVWRSNKDKSLHLLCGEGAEAFMGYRVFCCNGC